MFGLSDLQEVQNNHDQHGAEVSQPPGNQHVPRCQPWCWHIYLQFTVQWLGGSDLELGVPIFPISSVRKMGSCLELLRVSQSSDSLPLYL